MLLQSDTSLKSIIRSEMNIRYNENNYNVQQCIWRYLQNSLNPALRIFVFVKPTANQPVLYMSKRAATHRSNVKLNSHVLLHSASGVSAGVTCSAHAD